MISWNVLRALGYIILVPVLLIPEYRRVFVKAVREAIQEEQKKSRK